ncbi:outer membrane transport energization protein TonB [Fluviicoccus keumensis]|uniref:Outer membrane transport energization protein TonB n=1 Tax=Fluviicoccus keumensis TaxID=1435465 RepID=A0A4Q7YHY2_9GAMM|nr:AgmX/PglI C-terminal domain-containing protein [Fluviicoccus keumensis]RZU37027.1 outer membrane transport energization protein TonB [Fluviicoccus keumensis]
MNTILIKPALAWDELPEDAQRSRRINTVALILGLLCFFIIPNVKLPKIDRTQQEAIPERMAHIIREKKIELPPPPPKPLEQKKVEEKKAAVEEPVAKSKPMEIKKPSETATAKQINDAKAKAGNALKASGVVDALADLRSFETAGESMAKNPGTGGDLQKNSGEPIGTSRNMITSRAGAGSGGLAYQGAASSGFGGGVAGGKGGKGDFNLGPKGAKDMKGGLISSVQGVGGAGGGRGAGNGGGRGEGGIGKRTPEEIRYIFNKYSAKIDSAYARALKDDPSLEGTISLRLVIDPNGSVTSCEVAASELNNPELEAKIVAIVKSFNFGDDNVEVWKGKFPVNLYPK